MLGASLAELSQSLASGTILPSSVASLVLRRRELLRKLNVFVTEVPPEQVLQRVEETGLRHSKGRALGPLDGVPFTFKDNFCFRGVKTTCASKMLDNFTSPYSATVVQRVLDQGGVAIGKTNLDEFGMGSGNIDSYVGPAKNVWGSDLEYQLVSSRTGDVVHVHQPSEESDWVVAGGSSGGSAVTVAAGVAAASLGSDTGGSVRIPAAWCGVASVKPSYGRLSRHGLVPLVNSLDCPGVLARSVEDCALVLGAISGRDPLDSTSVDCPAPLEEQDGVAGLTVGLPQEFLCEGMSREIVETWSKVADLLEKGGAKVVPVSLPHTELAIPCYSVLNPCEVASNMARYDGLQFGLRGPDSAISTEDLYASSRSQGFNECVRGRILAGNYFLLKENYNKFYLQALKVRRLIAQDYLSLWHTTDLLLTPVTLTDAPSFTSFSSTDNRSQTAVQDFCTQPINLAGLPAVTLPVSLSCRHLPLSVQLVGPVNQDHLLMRVGQWLEEQVDFPRLVLQQASGSRCSEECLVNASR